MKKNTRKQGFLASCALVLFAVVVLALLPASLAAKTPAMLEEELHRPVDMGENRSGDLAAVPQAEEDSLPKIPDFYIGGEQKEVTLPFISPAQANENAAVLYKDGEDWKLYCFDQVMEDDTVYTTEFYSANNNAYLEDTYYFAVTSMAEQQLLDLLAEVNNGNLPSGIVTADDGAIVNDGNGTEVTFRKFNVIHDNTAPDLQKNGSNHKIDIKVYDFGNNPKATISPVLPTDWIAVTFYAKDNQSDLAADGVNVTVNKKGTNNTAVVKNAVVGTVSESGGEYIECTARFETTELMQMLSFDERKNNPFQRLNISLEAADSCGNRQSENAGDFTGGLYSAAYLYSASLKAEFESDYAGVPAMARVDDTVTLKLYSYEPWPANKIVFKNVKIAGNTPDNMANNPGFVLNSNAGGDPQKKYVATFIYRITRGAFDNRTVTIDEGNTIPFEAKLLLKPDSNTALPVVLTNDENIKVEFVPPMQIETLRFMNTNGTQTAQAGETLQLTFTTNHRLNMQANNVVRIGPAGNLLACAIVEQGQTQNGKWGYTATYQLPGNIQEGTLLKFDLRIVDDYGQTIQTNNNTQGEYGAETVLVCSSNVAVAGISIENLTGGNPQQIEVGQSLKIAITLQQNTTATVVAGSGVIAGSNANVSINHGTNQIVLETVFNETRANWVRTGGEVWFSVILQVGSDKYLVTNRHAALTTPLIYMPELVINNSDFRYFGTDIKDSAGGFYYTKSDDGSADNPYQMKLQFSMERSIDSVEVLDVGSFNGATFTGFAGTAPVAIPNGNITYDEIRKLATIKWMLPAGTNYDEANIDYAETWLKLKIKDEFGREAVIEQSFFNGVEKIRFYPPIKLEPVSGSRYFNIQVKPSGESAYRAVDRGSGVLKGDTVQVTFKTERPIATGTTAVAGTGSTATIANSSPLAITSIGGNRYTFSYQLPNPNYFNDNDVIRYTMLLRDAADNVFTFELPVDSTGKLLCDDGQVLIDYPEFPTYIGSTADLHYVVYYGDLRPVLGMQEESGTNALPAPEQLIDTAINGDWVVLTVSLNYPVVISQATIAGETVNVSDTAVCYNETENTNTPRVNGRVWTIRHRLSGGDVGLTDNGTIPFRIKVPQTPWRSEEFTQANYTANSHRVRYYAPISPSTEMISNNENAVTVAKNGDEIIVRLTAQHRVTIQPGAKIGGIRVYFTEEPGSEGKEWVARCNLNRHNLSDQEFVTLEYTMQDGRNPDYAVPTGAHPAPKTIRYYAPIVITSPVFTSNNEMDGTRYAKNGDEVSVAFLSNHEIAVADTVLANRAAQPSKTSSMGVVEGWQFTHRILGNELRDLADVEFSFTATDPAGNTPVTVTQDGANNRIQYYAPITAATGVFSNGRNRDYAKNGDTVTIKADANHEVKVTEGFVAGRTVTSTGNDTPNVTMTYQIPGGERGMPEGDLPFQYGLMDPAGNRLQVAAANDGANPKVTYDRTAPQMILLPDFSGFTNEDVELAISVEDENLDGSGMSLQVNSKEIIGGVSTPGKSYRSNFTLSDEGSYSVQAKAVDLAGNETVQNAKASITIDKTNPEIRLIKLDYGTSKTFKAGISLKDILLIEEDYPQEVLCTLTDMGGVHEWDLDKPIEEDGKKTTTVLVTDMAGNSSDQFSLDFYIDGTPPKPIVMAKEIEVELPPDESRTIAESELTLSIQLDQIHVGDQDPDTFTKLQLLDKDGTLIADLLEMEAVDGVYDVNMTEYGFGSYALEVAAVDGVGNETGTQVYKVNFTDKTLWRKFYDNKVVFFSSFAVLLAASAFFVVRMLRHVKKGQKMS